MPLEEERGEFLGLRVDFCSSKKTTVSSHTIYCKRHIVRRDEAATPSRRTLFCLGWPCYCSESQVEAVFSRVGCVTAVYMQINAGKEAQFTERGGGRVAYVVFSEPEELGRAVAMCAEGGSVRCEVVTCGMRRWCEEYARARPVPADLDKTASQVVGQYDRHEVEQERVRKGLSLPDSDGWVTVVSKRPHSITQSGSRKKKKKKLLNFYQFQERESKREAVAELRRKFHKDKERVAELKARRKFRPF